MLSLLGLGIVILAVVAIVRGVEVRLALLLAAFALGTVAGDPLDILRTLLTFFTREQFLLPIGCCMGFAYVLKHTECDQHLVHLLLRPLQRVRTLLVPGVVLLGVVVNVPIISQTSTAVAVGSVLVPVLRAAGISQATTGAALVLGASMGGELLNPGAPELRTISSAAGVSSIECVARTWKLLLIHLAVTVPLFWWLTARADRAEGHVAAEPIRDEFRVNIIKALVPVIPLGLLFLTALPPGLRAIDIPQHWLVAKGSGGSFESRLIGAAMLVGVVVAALTSPRKAPQAARAFFEGAGYAFTHIISVIVAASCFGRGVEICGLARSLEDIITSAPGLLFPLAAAIPLGFAWVCGSGMASTQSVYGFFVEPAAAVNVDPVLVGSVVSLSAAAGRTMSPVAAVVLMGTSLTGGSPLPLVKRVALPLLAGIVAVVLAAMIMGSSPGSHAPGD